MAAGIRLPLGGRPYSVATSSTGVVYVSQLDSSALARFPLTNYAFAGRIGVGKVPTEIAFTSNGTKAYVTSQFSQRVDVIDVASNTVTSSIPVSGNPFAILVVPGDTLVWVTTTADSLFGIRATTGVITHRIPMPAISNGLALCDSLLYVSIVDSGTVSVVNTKRDEVVSVLRVGGQPQKILVSEGKDALYIADFGGVGVWDLRENAYRAIIPVTGAGFGLAQSPADGRLYVTTLATGQIQVLDPSSYSKLDSFVVGGTVRDIAFNATGTIAIAANEDGWIDLLRAPGVPGAPMFARRAAPIPRRRPAHPR